MNKFWELFQQSIIVQSVITLALISLIIYQSATGQEITEIIKTLTYLVVGFWFGSKVENATSRAVVKKLTDGS